MCVVLGSAVVVAETLPKVRRQVSPHPCEHTSMQSYVTQSRIDSTLNPVRTSVAWKNSMEKSLKSFTNQPSAEKVSDYAKMMVVLKRWDSEAK